MLDLVGTQIVGFLTHRLKYLNLILCIFNIILCPIEISNFATMSIKKSLKTQTTYTLCFRHHECVQPLQCLALSYLLLGEVELPRHLIRVPGQTDRVQAYAIEIFPDYVVKVLSLNDLQQFLSLAGYRENNVSHNMRKLNNVVFEQVRQYHHRRRLEA